MLGAFHMAKCVLHCIGKYVKGCGLEDSFLETNIFGLKVLESVLSASNYVRALRGIQILQCSIEAVKWQAFWEFHPPEQFSDALGYIQQMQEALIKTVKNVTN